MAVTLRDFFEYLRQKRAKLAVWRYITAHLQSEFLSTDVSGPSSTLSLDNGEPVSEEEIEEIIDTIYQDYIAPTEKKVVDLMDTELDEKLNELRAEKREERTLEEGEPAKLRKRAKKSK